jgi:hypothetical protein
LDIAILRTRFTADYKDLDRGYDHAARRQKEFAREGKKYGTVNLNLTYKDYTRNLKRVEGITKTSAARMGKTLTLAPTLNTGNFNRSLKALQTNVTKTVTNIKRQIASIGGGGNIQFDIVARGAEQTQGEIQTVTRAASQLDGDDVNFDINANGAAGAITQLTAVGRATDSLDGRTYRVGPEGRSLQDNDRLNGSMREVASNLRNVSTLITAMKWPFLIAGVGGAIPVVASLTSGALALAQGLGRAGAGLTAVGAVAAGGAVVGLKAYAAGLMSVAQASREAWSEQNAKAAEQLSKQRQQILTASAASQRYNAEVSDLTITLTKLQAAIGRAAFPTITREMDYLGEIVAELQPDIAATAGEVTRIAGGFVQWFRTAQQGAVLNRTVGFINKSAISGASILHNLGITGVMAIQPIIPMATDLQTEIMGLANAAAEWTKSTEGQAVLQQIFSQLYAEGRQLLPVFGDLAKGLYNVFSSLQGAGLTGQMMGGLASIASGFAKITAEGTRSGEAMDAFFGSVGPIIDATFRALGAFGAEILRVANTLVTFKNQGQQITVLEQTLNALAASARPIGNLLISTFKALGPEIPQLVTNIAQLAETFAGSTSTLVLTVQIINDMMTAFNALPTPVKTAVANFVAFQGVMSALGGPTIFGLIGAFTQLKLAMNVATIARASTGSVGIFSRLLSGLGVAVRGVGTAFMTLIRFVPLLWTAFVAGGPIVWVIVGAIAALAAGAFLIYKNWNTVGPIFQAVFNILKQGAMDAVTGIRTFVGWVVQGARDVGTGIRTAATAVTSFFGSLGQRIGQAAGAVGQGVANLARSVVQGIQRLAQQAGQRWSQFWGGVGRLISRAANGVRQGVSNLARSVVQGIQRLAQQAGQRWTQFWSGLGKLVSRAAGTIGRGVATVARSVVSGIQKLAQQAGQRWNQFWSSVGQFLQQRAQQIGTAVQGLRTRITQTIQQLASQVSQRWNQFWTSVGTFFSQRAQSIGTAVQGLRTRITQTIQQLASQVSQRWNQFWTSVGSFLSQRAQSIGNTVNSLRTRVTQTVQNLAQQVGQRWNQLWTAVGKFITTRARSIGNTINSMRNRIAQIVKQLGTGIQKGFNAIAGFMTKPIERAQNTLKSIWNAILEGIAKVLSAVQLKSAANKLRGAKWEGGGTTEGREFAQGGFSEYAQGGIGTNRKKPMVHMWNEQQGHEAYIVENRPTREQLPYLQTAAGWHGMGLVPMQRGGYPQESRRKGWPPELSWDLTDGHSLTNSVQASELQSPVGSAEKAWSGTGINWGGGGGASWNVAELEGSTAGVTYSSGKVLIDKALFPEEKENGSSNGNGGGREDDRNGGRNRDSDRRDRDRRDRRDRGNRHDRAMRGILRKALAEGDRSLVNKVVYHEMGHALRLGHGGSGIMAPGTSGMTSRPTDADIDASRNYLGTTRSGLGKGAEAHTRGRVPKRKANKVGPVRSKNRYSAKLPKGRGKFTDVKYPFLSKFMPLKRQFQLGGTTYNWAPWVEDRVRDIERNNEPTEPNTYTNHPGGEPYSADFWGAGGRGDPVGAGQGDQIKSYILSKWNKDLDWIIWEGMIDSGAGPQPYTDPADMHYDHVHSTWHQGAGGASGGGGGLFQSLWNLSGERIWNASVQPLVDRIINQYKDDFVLAYAGAQTMGIVTDAIKSWIIDNAGGSSATGDGLDVSGGSHGGNPTQNRSLGQQMLRDSGVSGSFQSLDYLWQKESGWNRLAENPSSGAYGIPQALPPSKMGSDALPPKSWADAQIRWGLGYIQDRYGSTDAAWQHSEDTGWYRRGGMVPGSGRRIIGAHGGEAVLPRKLTQEFLDVSRLLRTLRPAVREHRGEFPGGGGGPSVDALVDEVQGLRAELRRRDERLHADLVERVPLGIAAASKQVMDNALATSPATRRAMSRGMQEIYADLEAGGVNVRR